MTWIQVNKRETKKRLRDSRPHQHAFLYTVCNSCMICTVYCVLCDTIIIYVFDNSESYTYRPTYYVWARMLVERWNTRNQCSDTPTHTHKSLHIVIVYFHHSLCCVLSTTEYKTRIILLNGTRKAKKKQNNQKSWQLFNVLFLHECTCSTNSFFFLSNYTRFFAWDLTNYILLCSNILFRSIDLFELLNVSFVSS